MPELTVFTAPIGTPELTPHGIVPANVGHMYFSVTYADGTAPASFGFGPATPGNVADRQ